MTRTTAFAAAALLALGAKAAAQPARGTVAFRAGTAWVEIGTRHRTASADGELVAAVSWRETAPGVEYGEVDLRADPGGIIVRAVLVRLRPDALAIALDANVVGTHLEQWTIGTAGADALVSVNAGQFSETGPWGWVVHQGREIQRPAVGPLSMALVIDSTGGAALLAPEELARRRERSLPLEALQSYPALLRGEAEVPPEVSGLAAGIDRGHRDARLAVGIDAEGRVLLVLTRAIVFGTVVGPLPVGFTVPEMAVVMKGLGARRAMLLDGGLSGQLAVNPTAGEPIRWRGLRSVPIGLVVRTREVADR
ncbi:MAG: phosphodiester glycosidase family protein [Gemmatimonadales bacterium]